MRDTSLASATTVTEEPLVDEAALAAYLRRRTPGEATLTVERHRAGHSNETFFVTRGRQQWVLRRPPLGAFLPSAHDVGREYKVLAALEPTPVRAPRPLLMCTDESIIGAPFYLMERARGHVIRDRLPAVFARRERARVGTELVDALVELHSVDPAEIALEGFGRSSGYLERQLRRWGGQLELTIPLTRPLPALEEIGRWLAANLPATQRTTIVHGDYKLDNVMFSAEAPARVVAILDWEMSTLGDPLADLGWMISFWQEPGDGDQGVFADLTGVTAQPGFATREELIERYRAATGLDARGIDWYVVLAIWKLAILLEGSYARHLSGATDDPFFSRVKEGVPDLARRALALIRARG